MILTNHKYLRIFIIHSSHVAISLVTSHIPADIHTNPVSRYTCDWAENIRRQVDKSQMKSTAKQFFDRRGPKDELLCGGELALPELEDFGTFSQISKNVNKFTSCSLKCSLQIASHRKIMGGGTKPLPLLHGGTVQKYHLGSFR